MGHPVEDLRHRTERNAIDEIRFGSPIDQSRSCIAGCLDSCSAEVKNLATGRQQPGSVSISVGLLCVRSGLRYCRGLFISQVW